MTKDQLSPEDRDLYDAFFRAYGLKYAELHAAAGEGAEISLDACTVHAIKVMTEREIGRRLEGFNLDFAVSVCERAADAKLTEIFASGGAIYSAPSFIESQKAAARKMFDEVVEHVRGQPAPRIVSAVGVGVRVKRDDEEGGA